MLSTFWAFPVVIKTDKINVKMDFKLEIFVKIHHPHLTVG